MTPPNYIDVAAAQIKRQLADPMPAADNLFRDYAALMYSHRGKVTAEEVHNVWASWADGIDPTDPDLRPFTELTVDIQARDQPVVDAIWRAWEVLASKSPDAVPPE